MDTFTFAINYCIKNIFEAVKENTFFFLLGVTNYAQGMYSESKSGQFRVHDD